MAATADSLYVADALNKRVLRFSPVPTGPRPVAVQVFGQPDFTTASDDDFAVTGKSLDEPNSVAVGGSKVIIGDTLTAGLCFMTLMRLPTIRGKRAMFGDSLQLQQSILREYRSQRLTASMDLLPGMTSIL